MMLHELCSWAGCFGCRAAGCAIPSCQDVSQRLQNPIIKEYTLNIRIGTLIRFEVYSLIKGFWSLWECWTESARSPPGSVNMQL